MKFRCILSASLVALFMSCANAAQPPAEADIARFLAAFPVAQATEKTILAELKAVDETDPTVYKQAQCVLKEMDSKMFEKFAFRYARQHFTDRQRLLEIIAMLESPTGVKVTAQTLGVFPQHLKKILADDNTTTKVLFQLTPEDKAQIVRFTEQAGFVDYKSFMHGVRPAMEADTELQSNISRIHTTCGFSREAPSTTPVQVHIES